jgi:hypothetical protein
VKSPCERASKHDRKEKRARPLQEGLHHVDDLLWPGRRSTGKVSQVILATVDDGENLRRNMVFRKSQLRRGTDGGREDAFGLNGDLHLRQGRNLVGRARRCDGDRRTHRLERREPLRCRDLTATILPLKTFIDRFLG